ncbi:MAG: hypothetical protein R3C12_04365 [Planctomycetaceae bacterium]
MESGPPDGKLTKLPIDPRTMKEASSTDPATWGTFGASLRRVEDGHAVGVGFVLSADDPYVFVDIDGCRNPSTGLLSGLAEDLVERFTSWTEVSPSGTGLHIIIRGVYPRTPERKTQSTESSAMTGHDIFASLAARSGMSISPSGKPNSILSRRNS